MTRDQAIDIARRRALNSKDTHAYLPVTDDDAKAWMPHEWVIDAIQAASEAERKSLSRRLQAEAELDGFGCACLPHRVCGTCNARDTIHKALAPLMRELGA